MMWIRLTAAMSGTRANGDRYPPPWTAFLVEDWEGENLVHKGGIAQQVMAPPIVAPPPMPVPEHALPPASATAEPLAARAVVPPPPPPPDLGRAFTPQDARAPEPAPPPAPTAPRPPRSPVPPAPGEPKQAWVDHAIVRGEDADVAARMTKADLQAKYGSRL
jgi:hypothetical protein